jgi:hypothetical protein
MKRTWRELELPTEIREICEEYEPFADESNGAATKRFVERMMVELFCRGFDCDVCKKPIEPGKICFRENAACTDIEHLCVPCWKETPCGLAQVPTDSLLVSGSAPTT